MEEISAAINLIDVKKEDLRDSFLHLQSQSPSSFDFNSSLKWSDLDSYFTTLRFSLQHKFNLLHRSDTTSVLARPELISLCKNSDGLGLKRFIALAPDRPSLLAELPDAYRYAPDAAAMVLNAIAAFHSDNESHLFKTACLDMLAVLMRVKPDISIELKDKAMEIAMGWNRTRVLSSGRAKERNTLGFLHLVVAYGLIDRFCIDELIDCFVIVAKKRDTIRQLIPADKINDVIEKLIKKDMHITAVNLSIDFKKTDEFPPVRLLEERKLMCMRVIEETHVSYEVMLREINTLKSIIKCIDENELQSEYPKDSVVEVVTKLENEVERLLLNNNLASRAVFKPKPDKPELNKSVQQASDHHVGNAFYVPQPHPPSAYNSNGWISD